MSSWADTVDEELNSESTTTTEAKSTAAASQDNGSRSRSPTDGPPPGFEEVASKLAESTVKDDEEGTVDAPETALKSDTLLEIDAAEEAKIEVKVSQDSIYSAAATFEELGLSKELLEGLYTEMKFEKPSKIQAKTLPMILSPPYRSLIAQAHNGSGKTTCFVLGMLSRCNPSLRAPQALCVCPTRELVMQNLRVLTKMGKFTGLTCATTADHIELGAQVTAHIVIGTPGKLKSWMKRGRYQMMNPKDLQILVFDEADQMMATDGFRDDSVRMINDINQALKREHRELQILLFSATFNDRVTSFCRRVITNPNEVIVPKEELSLDKLKQYLVVCPTKQEKTTVLKQRILPQCDKLGQAIIFVRTRENARQLHNDLQDVGHKVTSIEGGMDHEARDRVIDEFRCGTTKILIATDVLARGFDQRQVTLVVNYDPPTERDFRRPAFETYLHRIGRSGRFGQAGAAFNLVCGEQEMDIITQISNYFQKPIQPVQYNDEDAFETVLVEAGLLSPEEDD